MLASVECGRPVSFSSAGGEPSVARRMGAVTQSMMCVQVEFDQLEKSVQALAEQMRPVLSQLEMPSKPRSGDRPVPPSPCCEMDESLTVLANRISGLAEYVSIMSDRLEV